MRRPEMPEPTSEQKATWKAAFDAASKQEMLVKRNVLAERLLIASAQHEGLVSNVQIQQAISVANKFLEACNKTPVPNLPSHD